MEHPVYYHFKFPENSSDDKYLMPKAIRISLIDVNYLRYVVMYITLFIFVGKAVGETIANSRSYPSSTD